MEKKKIIILIIILVVLITGIVTIKIIDISKNKKGNISTEICEAYSNDLDVGLKTFLSNEEYKSYIEEKQIEIMNEFLKCYENKEKIKGLTYVEETKMFEFKDDTGASRGIMMKEFNNLYK